MFDPSLLNLMTMPYLVVLVDSMVPVVAVEKEEEVSMREFDLMV